MAVYTFAEGRTEAFLFQILADGSAMNLAGQTVTLQVVKAEDLSSVTLDGTITITDSANGKVSYEPSAADLLELTEAKGPFLVRWKLTDGAGKIAFAPTGANPDQWRILTP